MTQDTAVEISDEVVRVALNAADAVILKAMKDGAEDDTAQDEAMRAALQAAIPLVVEGLVKKSFIKGWDTCHDRWSGKYVDHNHVYFDLSAFIESNEILAKVKK